jgi:uncharacterized membrane-anchored protein YjiN (DUF445 family)
LRWTFSKIHFIKHQVKQKEIMSTNVTKKGLKSLHGSLSILIENKSTFMSNLAEIAIIINKEDVRNANMLDDSTNEFLQAIHFLLNSLDNDTIDLLLKSTTAGIDAENIENN